MVRGIGLGQHPIPHDPEAEHQIRHTFALLSAKGVVYGVVFAKSLDDASTGYALTIKEVSGDIQAGIDATSKVSSGGCAAG